MDRRIFRPSVAENAPPWAPVASEPNPDFDCSLWDRFWTHGERGLLDEEFLALFLTLHLTEEHARMRAAVLMQKFEHLGEVLAASPQRLMLQGGLDLRSAQDIKFAETMLRRVAQARTRRRPVNEIKEALLGYLRATLGSSPIAKVVILYLDRALCVIDDEEHARGTAYKCRVYTREIARRCLQLDACAVIVGVSRPCGDHGFRIDDLEARHSIAAALHVFEVDLYDYLVISSTGTSSMLGAGMLQYPRKLSGGIEQGGTPSEPFVGSPPGRGSRAGS